MIPHLLRPLLLLVVCCLASVWGADAVTVDGGTSNVGIGTEAPTERLHVAGNLRVDGEVVGAELPGASLVSVYRSADVTGLAADTAHVVPFDVEEWDLLGEFDPATGCYTAASAKRVDVRAVVFADALTIGERTTVKFEVDDGTGFTDAAIAKTAPGDTRETLVLARTVDLAAGDVVKITLTHKGAGFTIGGLSKRTYVQFTRR